jgi:hypothetical protein
MKIKNEIKEEVQTIVDTFNKKNKSKFTVKFRGKFCYLDKGRSPVGRLEFDGDMESWSFAVYKYSSNGYDPDEWFFPGQSELDGTIEGGLRAGLEIY